jgi:hypothetical protein
VGLVLVTAPAWGEEEDPQPGSTRPAQIGVAPICPCTFGPLLVETAVPLEKGAFSIQPLFALSFTGGIFSPNWQLRSAGGDFLSLSIPVKFTYGLTSNLEVFVIVPYTHNWASHVEEPGSKGERNADFGGLGDIFLSLKYRFVKETDTRPTVTAFCAVEFPSGHHSPLNPARLGTDEIGSGHYRFTGGVNVSKWVHPFIFYGNLWYSMATTRKSSVPDEFGGFTRETLRAEDFLNF